MIKNINKGHTLLVRGPARITILEGKIDVFGKIYLPEKEKEKEKSSSLIDNKNVLIVPSAQSYPLFAVDNSKSEIYGNVEENLIDIEENSISHEWIEIKDSIIKEMTQNASKPLKIMVLGISYSFPPWSFI